MSADSLPRDLGAASDEWRLRSYAIIANARIANAWVRLGASATAAILSAALLETLLPLWWLLSFGVLVVVDRAVHKAILARCQKGVPPKKIAGWAAWTALQAAYGNALAIILWFSQEAAGQTLAVLYLCGSLANAATTLRRSSLLSIASVSTTFSFLLFLPVAEFFIGGARDVHVLTPILGVLLLLAWGANLWRSLVASDVAQALAEASALRERQASAAAAAAKAEAKAEFARDLRTPLGALSSAVAQLRRERAVQTQSSLAAIAQAHSVLLRAYDEASGTETRREGVTATDPRALVLGSVQAFRAAARDKNIEIFADVASTAPSQVLLDAGHIQQVLFHLIANAVAYTMHGGVRVRLKAKHIGHDRVALAFSISDTGEGVSRSKLALIFQNADQENSGLAKSIRLARAMGGKLTASSELGEGSVFTLLIEAPAAAPGLGPNIC